MIFGTLAWTIELYMTKYIIGENFSSDGATLYKNPSDKTVYYLDLLGNYFLGNSQNPEVPIMLKNFKK